MAAPRPARRTARLLVGLALGALLFLLLVRALGVERGTVLTLLVGALPLTLTAVYPLLAGALALRSRVLTALALVVVAGQVAVVVPTLGAAPVPARARTAARLRVVTANLYVLNEDPEATGRALRALHPDVLVVPELTVAGQAALRASGLLDDLPFDAGGLGGRAEGVGLFSRLPLTATALHPIGVRLLPRATVRVGGVDVRLLAGHPLPPFGPWESLWRTALTDLAREVRSTPGPVVVAGDLNADRDHAALRRVLGTGLRDAADERGHGVSRTWPAGHPLLQLDHVLVRDGGGTRLVVLDERAVRVPGTDHRAVLADLAVLPPR
ncbi:MAG: hypothetical protein JWN17_2312 [Frankiales bacterium]|nr:hypothetical protein [Frankiales bacterium]